MYRWLLRDDITVHYATVHRACQRLVSDGLIEYVDGTTELVPTDKGRQTLVTNTLQ
jgi:DNA-binding transcriptional regulator YhcF (GntR family)